MDNEPQPTNKKLSDLLSVLRNPGLVIDIANTEKGLEDIYNKTLKSPQAADHMRVMKNFGEAQLNNYIDNLHEQTTFTVSGYAYCADQEGTLYLDSDNNVVQGIINLESLMYDGLKIFRLPYDLDNTPTHKVICKFNRITNQANGTVCQDTYYISPSDLLELTAGEYLLADDDEHEPYEYPYESDQLRLALEQHAEDSEKVIDSPNFKNASNDEQRTMLQLCAQETEQSVIATYSDDTIEVETSEFFIVNESGISFVDQTSMPPRDWNIPTGEVIGCNFLELIQHATGLKLSSPIRPYPSIVLSNYETGSLYYIPIRAFSGALVIESGDDYPED